MDTPLMKQYKEIKAKYSSEILFFRLGDFYEMFFDDAKIAAKELDLTLTARNKEKGVEIPLAGIPYHAASGYIAKLVSRGYSVAICEQVEDPRLAKGLVKREVIRTITPGTFMEMEYIDQNSNNYILTIKNIKTTLGVSYIDVTTGSYYTTEFLASETERLKSILERVMPVEIIVDEKEYKDFFEILDNFQKLNRVYIKIIEKKSYEEAFLLNYFQVYQVTSLGLEGKNAAIASASQVLDYVLEKNNFEKIPITAILYVGKEQGLELNSSAQKKLELVTPNYIGSLFWVLNKCKTAMGSRYLKSNILSPLSSIEKIHIRQKYVQYFFDNFETREEIQRELTDVLDLERLFSKVIYKTANGKDLIAIKNILMVSKTISNILGTKREFLNSFNLCEVLLTLLEISIHDVPPFSVREGGMIKTGYNSKIDEYRQLKDNAEEILESIQERERERTGIKSLKIRFNKVFGYYIEITQMHLEKVPSDYIRKQTLSNAERYITPELKEYETKILSAQEKLSELEYEKFKEVCATLLIQTKPIYQLAKEIAELDFFVTLAQVAKENGYVKPILVEDSSIELANSRHPIVEKLVGSDKFIKNDSTIDLEKRFLILTGPNMAGKSTYMKQVALCVIMAQMGSFVPADHAKIGVVDKIFTRIGASDNILLGESTFMVEMAEVSNILRHATNKSFIILDEVGRGTSTFDGISIAWAVSEYIAKNINAMTLFATHYHELTELERAFPNVKNYRFEVLEEKGKVHFLRKVVSGGADKSYGLEVAKLAGLPLEVIKRGRHLLRELESRKKLVSSQLNVCQLSLFDSDKTYENQDDTLKDFEQISQLKELESKILMLELDRLSPIEALNFLYELKNEMS